MEKTTHTIWGIIDGDGPLEGKPFNNCDNSILFEVSCDTDDGTYPRLSDYMRDINALEKEGASHYVNRLTRRKNKLEIDFQGVKIIRESKWTETAVIEFESPVWVVIGRVGAKPVVQLVKKIRGEFDHDYFWTKAGRQNKVANGYEIWFKIKEYLE